MPSTEQFKQDGAKAVYNTLRSDTSCRVKIMAVRGKKRVKTMPEHGKEWKGRPER